MDARKRRRADQKAAREKVAAVTVADDMQLPGGGEAEAHKLRLEQTGVVGTLKAALELLFAQPYLAENPFAALVALMRHHSVGYELWGNRAPGAAAPPVLRPLRNELNPAASAIVRAKDTFEWWGLSELVELVDPKAALHIVSLVESQHGTQGGQTTEGEYTIRHMVALSGDWVFAKRALGFPGAIELRAEYSFAGPDRETAMEMFVLRIMEDVTRLGWGLEDDAAGHEHVIAKFHIEKTRKDDMAAVYADVKKALEREHQGLDLLGKKKKDAEQANLAKARAQAGVPLSRPSSDEWDIHDMRKSRQNFIVEVKAAINARRRVWVTYYALITDTPVNLKGKDDADDLLASPRSVISEGNSANQESEHSWYCRWDKTYTFHFQPRGDVDTDPNAARAQRENLAASPHETLFTSVFFTRHDAEDYLSWFESPVYDDRRNVPDDPKTVNQTFRQRMRARIKEHVLLSDGPAMLKALLKHLSLEPLAARDTDDALQAVVAILQSGAGEFSALGEEASTLSSVLQILLAPMPVTEGDESEMTETDFAMVDRQRRERQLVRVKGHFRLFRKRLMSAISRQEESNIEVAVAANWIRHVLRQMYDKRQKSLLVTRATIDLLRQLQVYCDAVALSTADALLDCAEASSVLKVAASAVMTVNHGRLIDTSEIDDFEADIPFVLRGSWSDRAAKAATLLSIEVAKEQQRMGGLRLVPPEIAKEAVYLQYSADTGLAALLPQLISSWALDPFPRNVYMATTRSLQHRMLHFDCFHQSDKQLLVEAKVQTTAVVPWRDSKMFEINDEDFSGSTDEDALQLYTVHSSDALFLLGSELALSCAPASSASSMIFELGESVASLLVNSNSFEGQYSWENCTGICGPAVLCGTVLGSLPSDLGGCLGGGRLYLTQDSCFVGPTREDAQEYFVDDAVMHIFDLLESASSVLITGVGTGRETDELVALHTLRIAKDGDVSDDSEAFEYALGRLLGEAVLDVGAIRLEGYVLHQGAYLPFTKHIQFHFGQPNFITLATHEWPPQMHLHERVYISDPYSDTHIYVAKLFARCHGAHRLRSNEIIDRQWLVTRIREEQSDPQRTSRLFLSVALLNSLALARFVPPAEHDADIHVEDPESDSEIGVHTVTDSWSSQNSQATAQQQEYGKLSQQRDRRPPIIATFQEGPMGVKWNVPGDETQPIILLHIEAGMQADRAGLEIGMELTELNGEVVGEMRKRGLDSDAIFAKMGERPLKLTLQLPQPLPMVEPTRQVSPTLQPQTGHGMTSNTSMYDSMRGVFAQQPVSAQSEPATESGTELEPEQRDPDPEPEQRDLEPEPEPEPERALEELPCLAECCRFFRSTTPLLRCARTNMRACSQLLREAASDRLLAANLQHEPLIHQFTTSAEFLRHFLRSDVGRAVHFCGVQQRTIRLLDEVEVWATKRAQAVQEGTGAEAPAVVDELALPVLQLEELETILALMEMAAAQDMRMCCTATLKQISRVKY